ncbi:hypothetical protein BC827DRAFT_1229387 [Russula dissimulans]|nr:hypothetical protein BC827DRAFT_1229387 [Russula dissimulans]
MPCRRCIRPFETADVGHACGIKTGGHACMACTATYFSLWICWPMDDCMAQVSLTPFSIETLWTNVMRLLTKKKVKGVNVNHYNCTSKQNLADITWHFPRIVYRVQE